MAKLDGMVRTSIEDLENSLGTKRLDHYVHECEAAFLARVDAIAARIADDSRIRAVFISGPTASGKTTFNDRLAGALRFHGRLTEKISLDDYYLYGQDGVPADAQGRPDYESTVTLDLALMSRQIADLLDGGEAVVPLFDFTRRVRVEGGSRAVRIPPNGVLLVEGLHGMSREVAGRVPRESRLGVFIMPYGSLVGDRQLLDLRDMRMLRRICRDVRHRSASALETLDYWPMIDDSEQTVFHQYLEDADEYVNSAMPYEFCVVDPLAAGHVETSLKDLAEGRLKGSWFLGRTSFADLPRALDEAHRLVQAIAHVPSADPRFVPDASILIEFIR
jgi:uridine kinase